MATYFVYRSPYHGPSGKHLKRFPDATVLDWFRNHWRAIHDVGPEYPAGAYAEELLGTHVYGFGSLFERIAEHALAAPADEKTLWRLLRENLYVEGEIRAAPHCLQVLTDDDELELAYYFFDDDYLSRYPGRADFLLNESWRLPGGHAAGHASSVPTTALAPRRRGPGVTYLVFHGYSDSLNLTDVEGGYRFSGLRLPDLARHLARVSPAGQDWPFPLRLLRAQLLQLPEKAHPQEKAFVQTIREGPGDETTWAVYSDWLQERGRPRAGPAVLERALAACTRYPVARIMNSIDTGGIGLGDLSDAHLECEGLSGRFKGRLTHEPARSLVHVEDHLAQLCLHTDRWGERDLFHQWFLFDDLWAGARPALADGVLRYARRWDVLS